MDKKRRTVRRKRQVEIRRTEIRLYPDQSRVVLRPLKFGTHGEYDRIIERVLALTEEEAESVISRVLAEFSSRHRNFGDRLLARFRDMEKHIPSGASLSESRKMLIGSYFVFEYSSESAGLFNPSIIPHPDQSGLAEGSMRFLMSLRSTGEGHISSISFRSGIIDKHNSVFIEPPSRFLSEPEVVENPVYDKNLFRRKISEMGLINSVSESILCRLGDSFSLDDLKLTLKEAVWQTLPGRAIEDDPLLRGIWLLAKSNYEIRFSEKQDLSERIIFPVIPAQSNGIEDVRLVAFGEAKGKTTYYATYTAYDGRNVLPQLFQTDDFCRFKFATLNGPGVQNKGMALFPRKINGHFAMLSRQDGENVYLMYSDMAHFWNEAKLVLKPSFPWEFLKMGNCGSPIETPKGWLVLSHGVGPVRKYCLGAFLLDKDDPSKVIGRSTEPLMSPEGIEREGYVPNVLYTCGALLHGKNIILPYGMSDRVSGFAILALDEIIASLKP